jgi:hypothetical protein
MVVKAIVTPERGLNLTVVPLICYAGDATITLQPLRAGSTPSDDLNDAVVGRYEQFKKV